MNCSVIVPVYNSADTLRLLVQRLGETLPKAVEQYELILVNDGSQDNSWEVIAQLSRQYSWICGINLIRNYGQHNATLCGVRAARYELIVTMDDDLQQPPEEIPLLLSKLEEGYDVVYGTPQKIQESLWRGLASRFMRLALRIVSGNEIANMVSPFRAFRAPIRDAFAGYTSPSVSIDVLLTWGAIRYAAVSLHYAPRYSGVSTYTIRKLVGHALDMITGFSTLPLRLASTVGFIFTLFGTCVLVYVIGRYFIEGGSYPGFPFLASVIAIFSGATLFALGIMGEYLARIYMRSMGQPPYIIRTVSEKQNDILHSASK